MSRNTALFLAVLFTALITIAGDICLKKAADGTWVTFNIILGACLYAVVAPFWYIVYKNVPTFTSLMYYWPIGSCLYLLTGLLVFGDRPKIREWLGIALGMAAKVIGG